MIEKIEQLILEVEGKYSGIGGRARLAAVWIIEGAVDVPDDIAGGYWKVSSETVNIAHGSCSCLDDTAPQAQRGALGPARLCAHMLAAMFVKKVYTGNGLDLLGILKAGRESGAEFKLKINIFFGAREQWTVTAYQMPGAAWLDLGPAQIRLDPRAFAGLCRLARVDMAGPRDRVKKGSIAFVYRLIGTDERPENLEAAHKPAALDAEIKATNDRLAMIEVTSDL